MSIDCSLTHFNITNEIIKKVRTELLNKKIKKLSLSNSLYYISLLIG